MEEKFKQFLKKQMEKEAEQIEKEVLSNESLKEVQAPDTLREALAKSIKEYEKNRTDAPSEESEEIGISIEEFCEKLSKEDRESYFRWTLGIPLTSPALKTNSFQCSPGVEPPPFTSDLPVRLRSLYTQ